MSSLSCIPHHLVRYYSNGMSSDTKFHGICFHYWWYALISQWFPTVFTNYYFETGSHVAQVWTCCVFKNNLELLTFPSPALEFWDDRHVPLCPLYAVLMIKSRAFHMLGKPSTSWSVSLIWWFLLTGPGLGNAKHMGYYLFITIAATINQLSHLQLNL